MKRTVVLICFLLFALTMGAQTAQDYANQAQASADAATAADALDAQTDAQATSDADVANGASDAQIHDDQNVVDAVSQDYSDAQNDAKAA